MKKPIILFAVLFAIVFYFFASIGMDEVNTHTDIAKSPGYALATPDGMTKTTRKRSTKYQINYTYQVDGTTYKIDSKSMDETAAQAVLATPNVQVAYSTKKPSVAVLKSEYDQRDPKESITGAILSAAGLALAIAAVAALFLSWKFPWLRRA